MQDGEVKAIVLQGINHHLDKIGVEDGMCDDLVNLRYKDGSWRTTGNGKLVYQFGANTYTNMYVHTNVYRHVLGSRKYNKVTVNPDGTTKSEQKVGLFWFANIDEDGEFTNINEVCICDAPATDKFIYAQTGHLLVVISQNVRTTLFFNRGENKYKQEEVLEGGNSYSHPLGTAKFKVIDRLDDQGRHMAVFAPTKANPAKRSSQNLENGYPLEISYNESAIYAKNGYQLVYDAMKKKGSFAGAFLVCLAVKLYSGDWTWATTPTLVCPSYIGDNKEVAHGVLQTYDYRENFKDPMYVISKAQFDSKYENLSDDANSMGVYEGSYLKDDRVATIETANITDGKRDCGVINWKELPTVGDCFWRPNEYGHASVEDATNYKMSEHLVWGKLNDLYINLSNINIQSSTVYKSIGVFVTPLVAGSLDLTETRYSELYNYGTWDHSANDQTELPFYIPQTYIKGQYNSSTIDYNESAVNNVVTIKNVAKGIATRWKPKHVFSKKAWDKGEDDIIDALKTSQFYLLKEIQIKDWKSDISEHGADYWKKIELKEEDLFGIGQDVSELLPANAFSSMSFTNAEYGMTFNGRLHLANYKKSDETAWGNSHLIDRDYSTGSRRYCESNVERIGLRYWASGNVSLSEDGFKEIAKQEVEQVNSAVPYIFSINNFEDQTHTVDKVYMEPDRIKVYEGVGDVSYAALAGNDILPNFIPFPSIKIDSIDIYINRENYYYPSLNTEKSSKKTATLTLGSNNEMTYYGLRFYFSFFDGDYTTTDENTEDFVAPTDVCSNIQDGEVDVPNGIIVSGANTPTYFTDEYLVGSSEIVAIAANAMAVGTGQTGDVPLYVFCKDGVYGLFIDSNGDIAYGTSRILTRDVVNSNNSVKPIDGGVVFTTDRGLMLMSGDKSVEIGQPVEGDWCKFSEDGIDKDKIATNAYKLNKIASLPIGSIVKEDFLTYIKGALVDYNHNERELILSNPDYEYSYVMDRDGNWSRRTFTADEYVNNFPTSYRVKDGKFYKVDEEDDSKNGMFIMTRELKLDSIGFKEINRLVARGFFETTRTLIPNTTGVTEVNSASRLASSPHNPTFVELEAYLGLYVYGSYDARKWVLLGHNEKKGSFNDIGCIVERSDCKFFRFVLAGSLKGTSRLDYFEVSSKNSKLGRKIR